MMGNDDFALPTATHTRVEFDACGLRGVAEYHVDNFGKRFFAVEFSRRDGTTAYSYDEDANTGDDIFAVYWGKLEFENHSLYPYIMEVKAACKALRSLEA